MQQQPTISVVIPTFNEDVNLLRLLPELLSLVPTPQVLVSDGGSCDNTLAVARQFGVDITSGAKGRGPQLNAGGLQSRGNVLLFLHADSSLPAESYSDLLQTLHHRPELAAGAFRFSLQTTPGGWARTYEFHVGLRNRLLHLPYGDQGFFIRRTWWEKGYQFADIPLMEDVEWWERVSRALPVCILGTPLITSARRFEQRGFLISAMRNLWMLTRYKLGVSPMKLVKEYTR